MLQVVHTDIVLTRSFDSAVLNSFNVAHGLANDCSAQELGAFKTSNIPGCARIPEPGKLGLLSSVFSDWGAAAKPDPPQYRRCRRNALTRNRHAHHDGRFLCHRDKHSADSAGSASRFAEDQR